MKFQRREGETFLVNKNNGISLAQEKVRGMFPKRRFVHTLNLDSRKSRASDNKRDILLNVRAHQPSNTEAKTWDNRVTYMVIAIYLINSADSEEAGNVFLEGSDIKLSMRPVKIASLLGDSGRVIHVAYH